MLTSVLQDYIPIAIPSHAEGRLISVSRCGVGSGGRGMTSRRRCGARARRSKPRLSWRADTARRGPSMARPTAIRRRSPARPGPARWRVTTGTERNCVTNGRPPGTARSKPKKHRARDALGFGGLAACLAEARKSEGGHYGLRQASMSRGVEARGSFGALGVPRALGTFGAGERIQETACPGPKKTGRRSVGFLKFESARNVGWAKARSAVPTKGSFGLTKQPVGFASLSPPYKSNAPSRNDGVPHTCCPPLM